MELRHETGFKQNENKKMEGLGTEEIDREENFGGG